MSEVEAAKRLKVPQSTLLAWEGGIAQPSLAQARRLAKLYRRPLAVLFLPEPPKTFDALQSFRRVHGAPDVISPSAALQIQEALERRETLIDLARDTGSELKPFALSTSVKRPAATAAAQAREKLGIETADQFRWQDAREALNSWRAAIERLDVLVFQLSRVKIEELRGVSIHQDVVPVIGINAADSPTGRIFSLAHELGHLILGIGELCIPEDESASADNDVEVWCNEFAGSLLVPASALLETAEVSQARTDPFGAASSLAARFRVSQEVVLRRFLTLERFSRRQYQLWRQAQGRFEDWQRPAPRAGKGGPSPDVKVLANFGRPYVRTVLEALQQDKITLSEATGFLGLKFKHFSKVQNRLAAADGEAGAEQ